MKQSLDGVFNRIIKAKSLGDVKRYSYTLEKLLIDFQEAKNGFYNGDMLAVKEFFDYYVVERVTETIKEK